MTEIMRAHKWGTNAAMIAEAVVPLGYIEGDVFDATYGVAGGFWTKYRPERLVTNDRATAVLIDGVMVPVVTDHHEDFCALPFPDRSFTTVVFDPDYKLNGTPAMGEMDARFGTWENLTRDQRMEKIRLGAIECYRLTSKWLLVKCMDQVEGGQMRWQTDMVTEALKPLGARKAGRFDFLFDPRPQPGDRRQLTERANYSTLLAFKKA